MPLPRLPLAAICVAAVFLAGCANTRPSVHLDSADATVRACADWFQRLDAAIEQSGVRDAEAHRLPGYVYLRSNRLLASFANDAVNDRTKFADWLDAMRDLDQRSRDLEIGNLPEAAVNELGKPDKAVLRGETRQCAIVLLAADSNSPDAPLRMAAASRVPDNYHSSLRALGLYPLVSIPFLDGIKRWQQRTVAEFERRRNMPFDSATAIRYVPAPTGTALEDPRILLARASRNALGIPQYSAIERDALFAAYAPVIEVDMPGDDNRIDNRIGSLVWRLDHQPAVDPAQPAVYRRVAFTRLGANVLTQLVYTFWFPRRTSSSLFDPIAGEFDGVIFRLTLGAAGRPLIADSIHACGCYHEFFPGPRLTLRPAPDAHLEWAFVPAPLPPLLPGTRIFLRLASGTHYLTGIGTSAAREGITYVAADEDDLRALKLSGAATRSIYGPDGRIAASKRGERFLFWPMGIASAGAMRQWGGHATAFVGRRHFDDADLFDKRFAISGE